MERDGQAPGGEDSRESQRLKLETRAQARFWTEEHSRRAGYLEQRLQSLGERGQPSVAAVRIARALPGGLLAAAVALVRGESFSAGPAASFDEQIDRRDAYKRLAELERRLRLAQALATLPARTRSLARRALRSGSRALAAAVVDAGTIPWREHPPATHAEVTAILAGDRLDAAWAERALRGGPRVVRIALAPGERFGPRVAQAIAAAETPYVLVASDIIVGDAAWLGALVDALERDPGLGAVAPGVRASRRGDAIDGGWRFDWRRGAPEPVLDTVAGPVLSVGGTCVLLRSAALAGIELTSGYAHAWWALDLSLELDCQGWRVAQVDATVEARPDAEVEGELALLCRRHGPALRQGVLKDLCNGGGRWCARGLRVCAQSAPPVVATSAAQLGWMTVDHETCDVRLRLGGDGVDSGQTLGIRWFEPDTFDEEGDPAIVPCRAIASKPSPADLRDAILDHLERPAISLQIGARDRAAARISGDRFLARALGRALRARGHWTQIVPRAEEAQPHAACFDILLHLRGRGTLSWPTAQRRVMWHISHPEEVADEELEGYDLVLVASRPHAAALARRLSVPVRALLQFTDPSVFRPPAERGPEHELLFVGNWRSVVRRVVWDALPARRELALYGEGWRHLVPALAQAEHVPNEELHRLYGSAKVVLADHWDDMRRHGFVSNRICDALACGAFVISDDFEEVRALFPGGLETYRDPAELLTKIDRYIDDDAARRAVAVRGREIVLESHTAELRAAELLACLDELAPPPAAGRPR